MDEWMDEWMNKRSSEIVQEEKKIQISLFYLNFKF